MGVLVNEKNPEQRGRLGNVWGKHRDLFVCLPDFARGAVYSRRARRVADPLLFGRRGIVVTPHTNIVTGKRAKDDNPEPQDRLQVGRFRKCAS